MPFMGHVHSSLVRMFGLRRHLAIGMAAMQTIQHACAKLSGHSDSFVQEIATADRQRNDECVKLKAKLSTITAQNRALQAEIKRKEAQIKGFQRDKFGRSSEKTTCDAKGQHDKVPDCSSNDDADCEWKRVDHQPVLAKAKPRGKRGKQKAVIPGRLRREAQIFEPAPDQYCACGCTTVRMGEQVIEKLAHKPAELYVLEEIYPKYTCRNCDRFVQAKVRARVCDYTRFGDSVIIGILIAKYADFLPFYRLE